MDRERDMTCARNRFSIQSHSMPLPSVVVVVVIRLFCMNNNTDEGKAALKWGNATPQMGSIHDALGIKGVMRIQKGRTLTLLFSHGGYSIGDVSKVSHKRYFACWCFLRG